MLSKILLSLFPFAMNQNITKLPKYKSPPINEVFFGVSYPKVDKFLTPHVGLFWNSIKSEFDKIEERDPISPKIEKFGSKFSDFNSEKINEFLLFPRIWFINKSGNEIFQIQQDQLFNNWRKISESDKYPHYESIVEIFFKRLKTFQSFLNEHSLGEFLPNQYELTYINHITPSNGFSDEDRIEDLFPDFSWKHSNDRFLNKRMDAFNFQLSFPLLENKGRLHIYIRKVLHKNFSNPIVLLQLTCRGFISPGESSMKDWFDLAHESIVLGFEDITSQKIQDSIWGKYYE